MSNSTLTVKGQTTIPLEVRKALGLLPGMKLSYELREGEVVLRPLRSGRRLAGILGGSAKAGADFAEAREIATKAWAQEAAQEGLEDHA